MLFFWFVTKLVKEVFGVSLATLLLLFIAEDIKTGFVSNYLDLRKAFLFCVGVGIVYLILSKFEEETRL